MQWQVFWRCAWPKSGSLLRWYTVDGIEVLRRAPRHGAKQGHSLQSGRSRFLFSSSNFGEQRVWHGRRRQREQPVAIFTVDAPTSKQGANGVYETFEPIASYFSQHAVDSRRAPLRQPVIGAIDRLPWPRILPSADRVRSLALWRGGGVCSHASDPAVVVNLSTPGKVRCAQPVPGCRILTGYVPLRLQVTICDGAPAPPPPRRCRRCCRRRRHRCGRVARPVAAVAAVARLPLLMGCRGHPLSISGALTNIAAAVGPAWAPRSNSHAARRHFQICPRLLCHRLLRRRLLRHRLCHRRLCHRSPSPSPPVPPPLLHCSFRYHLLRCRLLHCCLCLLCRCPLRAACSHPQPCMCCELDRCTSTDLGTDCPCVSLMLCRREHGSYIMMVQCISIVVLNWNLCTHADLLWGNV